MRLPVPCALLTAAFVFTGSAIAGEEKSKKALGKEWDVRVSARVVADNPSSPVVRVAWDVENLSERDIEIATVEPVASWDAESRVVTVNLGSELPVTDAKKLVRIAPHETKSFSVSAPLGVTGLKRGRAASIRRLVRVKLHFLDTGTEEQEQTADHFDSWIEQKRTVVTNAIPVTTAPPLRAPEPPPVRRAGGRRP